MYNRFPTAKPYAIYGWTQFLPHLERWGRRQNPALCALSTSLKATSWATSFAAILNLAPYHPRLEGGCTLRATVLLLLTRTNNTRLLMHRKNQRSPLRTNCKLSQVRTNNKLPPTSASIYLYYIFIYLHFFYLECIVLKAKLVYTTYSLLTSIL